MKHFSMLCLLFAAVTYSIPSQAQFFKKLKKTVNQAVSTVSSEINEADSTGNNASGGLYTVEATHTDLAAYDPVGVYTLQAGEKFDFTESCLAVHAGISSAQVVVIKDGKRYLVGKNGERTAVTRDNLQGCPVVNETGGSNILDFSTFAYSAPDIDKEACDHFEDLYVHTSTGIPVNEQKQLLNRDTMPAAQQAEMEAMADKMQKEMDSGTISMADVEKISSMMGNNRPGRLHYNKDSAGTFILFDHQKYGPYAEVQSMMVNKTRSKFVAIVTPGEPDMPTVPAGSGSLLITSEGLTKKYSFSRAELLPFGDFNHYRLMITGKMPEVLYDPATGNSIPVINNDEGNLKIDKTTGALIQMAGRQVYIDGRPIRALPEKTVVRPQNIFISEDHKQYAVWTLQGLSLSDGHTIDGVLSCNKQRRDKKTILSWIVLGKDNKTLYLCHKQW